MPLSVRSGAPSSGEPLFVAIALVGCVFGTSPLREFNASLPERPPWAL